MNARKCLWIVGLLWGGPVAAQSTAGSLQFGLKSGLELRSGDRLSGKVVSASSNTLRIQPYWADEDLEIPVTELSHSLQPGPSGNPLESLLILHFKSGDTLLARDLYTLEQGGLQATTLWDQTLTLKMEDVHAIRLYDQRRLLAQPASPDDSFLSLAGRVQLHTGGPLYQTLPVTYPDSFLVEVEVLVPDEDFQVQIQLFADEARRNLGRVVLEISNRRLSTAWFRRVENQGFRVESWQAENPVESSKYLIRLFGDMDNNRYTLFLNDQLIKTWDVEHMGTLLRGSNTPIQIRSTAGTGPVWLNSLRVLRWQGDSAPPAFLLPATRSETLLIFEGGREVKGVFHAIETDAVRFQPVDSKDVESYDRSKVLEVVFPDTPVKTASLPPLHSLHIFTNRSDERMRVEKMSITQGILQARAEWAEDELRVPMEGIQVLDFQPGESKEPLLLNPQTHPHHLRLLNGDQISGVYLGQDGEWLLFQPGWQSAPFRVHGKYVDRLLLGHQKPPAGEGWTLRLSNGDTVSGRLLEKTDEALELKTEWTDRLRIRMPEIKNLRKRLPGEDLLERGPSSMDDWVYSNRRESILTGDESHFMATADGWWLSRRGMVQKRLPEVQRSFLFSVHLHLPSSGIMRGGAGMVLTALPNRQGGYRMLQLTQRGDQWILNVTDPDRSGSKHVELASVMPDENGDIRFAFEFTHSEKSLRIRANGVRVHEWTNPDGSFTEEPYQPMITFSVNGGQSRLLIREWTLYALQSPFAFQPELDSKEGGSRVWLSNGDQLEGAWNGLSEEGGWMIVLSGSDEAFGLAPLRIQGFDFASGGEERIKRKASHVRLELNGVAEVFIAELVSADAEGVRIRREGWIGGGGGEWVIPIEQVEQLEFNPYWTGARGGDVTKGAKWIKGFR